MFLCPLHFSIRFLIPNIMDEAEQNIFSLFGLPQTRVYIFDEFNRECFLFTLIVLGS